MGLVDFLKILEAKVRQFVDYLGLKLVEKRSAFQYFLTVLNIDKEKGCTRIEEDFCNVSNIAALDQVLIKKHVRYLHQCLMHAILGVQEGEGMSSSN